MTTKQDYLNSIIQGLARVKLSEPSEAILEYLDTVVHRIADELDPNCAHVLEDPEWAVFILQAESRQEALDCFEEAERHRLNREQLRRIF